MKNWFSITVLLLACNYLMSQKIDCKWGESSQIFIGNTEGRFKQLDIKALQNIESKIGLSPIESYTLSKYTSGLRSYVQTKSHLYYPIYNIRDGREKVYFQEIDNQGQVKTSYKLISDDSYFVTKVIGAGAQIVNDIDGLAVSENGEKILKITSSGVVIHSEQQKFAITVLDENLNVLWTKTQEFSNYPDTKFSLKDFMVTDEGKVVLTSIVKAKSKSKKGNEELMFKVFSISKDQLIEGEIVLTDGKVPFRSKFLEESDGTITIAGFYGDQNNWTAPYHVTGSFIANFDGNSGKVKNQNSFAFDESVYEEPKPSKKTLAQGLSGFRLSGLFKSRTGTYLLIGHFGELGAEGEDADFDNGCEPQVIIGFTPTFAKKFESVFTDKTNIRPKPFFIGDNILMIYDLPGAKSSSIVAKLIDDSGKVISKQQFIYNGWNALNTRFTRHFGTQGVVVALSSIDGGSPISHGLAGRTFPNKYMEGLITLTSSGSH